MEKNSVAPYDESNFDVTTKKKKKSMFKFCLEFCFLQRIYSSFKKPLWLHVTSVLTQFAEMSVSG